MLIGDNDEGGMKGLCHMCNQKSSILKTIKRSSANALHLIHSLMFKKDYFLRNDVQDEFRGLDATVFVSLDLASHFKELSRNKKGENFALDLLVFIKVR